MEGSLMVTGRMLAGAMIRAHAAVAGGLEAKQAAGVGRFYQYLKENTARDCAWQKATGLFPSAVLARASLNRVDLETAGRLLEQATDVEQRRTLLGQVIAPHLSSLPKLPELELKRVEIPAGKFPMGSTKYDDEKFADGKLHDVEISRFGLGEYETTNEQFGVYMGQTGVAAPSYWEDSRFGESQPKNPVVGVNYYEANVFANWLGMRLPTEAEGEYAARGPEGLEYPWGNKWNASNATFFNTNGTQPVDAHGRAPSPFGAKDLSGNVWEWRADWYGNRYNPEDLVNPQGPKNGTARALRGGSWFNGFSDDLRSANRFFFNPVDRNGCVGFRVAEDLK
jgi:formylglycine-generating enzyme required for sulfatase activity